MAQDDYRRALVSGRGLPLREDDVDTDRIIPARYMKGVSFEGLGEYAFRDARFDEAGKPKTHPFNDPRFAGARRSSSSTATSAAAPRGSTRPRPWRAPA